MKVLIDTCTFLWATEQQDQLSRQAKEVLEDPRSTLLLSTATLWELSIKVSVGKLLIDFRGQEIWEKFIRDFQIEILPVHANHAVGVMKLPFHHRDPFDRLLISQCIIEKVPLLTPDRFIKMYDIQVIW